MKQRPDIVLKLPPSYGGKEEPVHRQDKHGSQSHVNQLQLHGHGLCMASEARVMEKAVENTACCQVPGRVQYIRPRSREARAKCPGPLETAAAKIHSVSRHSADKAVLGGRRCPRT